jgi:TPR repeat protein
LTNLAICFENGDGVEKSAEKAAEWRKRADECRLSEIT